MMNKHSSVLAAMAAFNLLRENTKPDTVLINQPPGERPWDNYHVPKAARKGKTPEEINALRKELWEQRRNDG
jgi:hypothetical protein